MSIMNKNYQIKFNNKDVNYTKIYEDDFEKDIKIRLMTDLSKKSIIVHIFNQAFSIDNDVYQKIILNSDFYNEFVDFCNNIQKKKSEDNKGNLTNNFFKYNINENYKFKSGPMTEKLFKIIDIQKNKLTILLGRNKATINKNEFLFYPV